MDVERTIQFLRDHAVQSEARWSARMDRLEGNLSRLVKGLQDNQTLTFQLIGVMSQQAASLAKLSRETDRRFKETDRQIKETSESVKTLSKKMDAWLSASARSNGHGKKNKRNGPG